MRGPSSHLHFFPLGLQNFPQVKETDMKLQRKSLLLSSAGYQDQLITQEHPRAVCLNGPEPRALHTGDLH